MSQYKPLEGCQCFHLDEPDNEPSTLRLIQALRGVSAAIEEVAAAGGRGHDEMALNLGTAASILSEMLQNRVVTP